MFFFFPLETELPRLNGRLPWPLTSKTDSVWECILTFLLNSEETPSVHSSDILFRTFQIHLWPPQYNFFEVVEEKIGMKKKIILLLHHHLLLKRFIIKSYFSLWMHPTELPWKRVFFVLTSDLWPLKSNWLILEPEWSQSAGWIKSWKLAQMAR